MINTGANPGGVAFAVPATGASGAGLYVLSAERRIERWSWFERGGTESTAATKMAAAGARWVAGLGLRCTRGGDVGGYGLVGTF